MTERLIDRQIDTLTFSLCHSISCTDLEGENSLLPSPLSHSLSLLPLLSFHHSVPCSDICTHTDKERKRGGAREGVRGGGGGRRGCKEEDRGEMDVTVLE